jgi:hypothetical protein
MKYEGNYCIGGENVFCGGLAKEHKYRGAKELRGMERV